MDIIYRLNWVDLLIVTIMVRTTYVSFHEGLSHEIIPLAGAFSSLLLSLCCYKGLAIFVSQNIAKLPLSILNLLAFAAIFVGVIFIFKLLRFFLIAIIKVTWHPFIEKFGGLAAGFIKGSLITSGVLIILVLLPLSYLKWSVRDRSLAGMYFLNVGPSIYSRVSGLMPALRVNGAVAKDESIIQELLSSSDSQVLQKKKVKKAEEWEKYFSLKNK